MCGISGFYCPSQERVDEGLLNEMGRVLRHRGPDHTGYFYDGNVGFCHNRLSLLDLSENGNQPFENERYVLIYNGEIYNFQQIRRELESEHGVRFRSTTDTEVLFYSLIHYGVEETLATINGMFAFAFFDKREKTLILARDRIGIKPLFFYFRDRALYFSSELKALSESVDLAPKSRLILYAMLGKLESTRKQTAFHDVHQVTPGTFVTLRSDGDLSEHVYFRTSQLVDEAYYNELNAQTSVEVIGRLRQLLRESVAKMSVSDAPMGAFLSGGIDSSLISAIGVESNLDLSFYTSAVEGQFDESKYANIVAKHLDKPLHSHVFKPEMFVRDWVDVTYHYESPIVVHTSAVPFSNIASLASKNKDKAVLTGEGSDELFLGYPRLLTERFKALIEFPYNLTNWIYRKIPGGLDRYLNLNQEDFRRDIERQVRAFEHEKREVEYQEAYAFIGKPKVIQEQSLSLRTTDTGLHTLLWRNDRMGMMHSLESRFPFLDEPVLSFAANLPVKFKIGRTKKFHNYKHPFLIDKFIVREVAKSYLPKSIHDRKKDGFPMYGHTYLKVDANYFKGGYWQEFMGLSDSDIDFMCEGNDPVLTAQLASTDIWGRLFIRRESRDEIHEDLIKHARMKIPG